MSSNDIPQNQSAWLSTKRGDPRQTLVLKTDYPVPSNLKDDEVLVKIYAAALNPIGWKLMRFAPNFIAKRPYIAEHDFAGTIVYPNKSNFSKGDAVFGWIPPQLTFQTGQGALAQYVRVPADHVAPKPSNVDFTQASGMALVGMTAFQCLKLAGLEAGQTIFINGGTTGVGSTAIQIAKAKGCRVVATTSTPNVDIVKGLGADEVIDYKTVDVIAHLKKNPPSPKFHVIFDTVGNSADLFTASPAYLAPSGVFASVGVSTGGFGNMLKAFFKTQLLPTWLGGTNRKFITIFVSNNKDYLLAVGDLVAEGKVKPLMDSTYSFNDVLKAYERIMTGRAKGKVVVQVTLE